MTMRIAPARFRYIMAPFPPIWRNSRSRPTESTVRDRLRREIGEFTIEYRDDWVVQ